MAPNYVAEPLESRLLLSSYALNTLATGSPHAGVVMDAGGNLFGTTWYDGDTNGDGSIFEVAHGSGTATTLASFNGANGSFPTGVIVDGSGNLYGTTLYGGDANGEGTIFEVVHGSGTIIPLASFDGADGSNPSGVVMDGSGNLYGTTARGGASGDGAVFELAAGSTTITTLASFNGLNGANPFGGVVVDGSGNLYGTTFGGGASGYGTVFEIVRGTGIIQTLASFDGSNGSPYAGVTLDGSGNLFGATHASPQGGSSHGSGTVFEIAHGTSAIQTLASFASDSSSGVTLDASGNVFGATALYPNAPVFLGSGTVFEIVRGSSAIQTLASFGGGVASPLPAGPVTLDSSGNLYGATAGNVFELVAQPAVSSFQVNDGSAQRSMVHSLTVQFKNPVTLGSGAITVAATTGTPVSFTMSSADGRNYLLSFNGSLPDGKYVVTVHAAGVDDSFGQTMAADQSYSFFRLFGDFNGDGVVSNADYFKFNSTFFKHATDAGFLSAFDYDNNGVIDNVDYFQFQKRYGMKL